nr:carbamoyltransferase HypF [bacterium]
VVKLIAGKMVPFRRSRGFAPVPIPLAFSLPAPVLALGSQMNCTVALGIEDRVYISQHIGDIDSTQTEAFYEETVNDLLKLFNTTPDIVISDMHPGYYSTRYGERYFKEKLNKVQHHYAHILSCMAENSLGNDREVIGIAFDGTGHGTDGTIWGSEIMTASYKGFIRKFHLLPFQLPGGDMAIKDPRRTAFSLLYSAFKKDAQNRAGDLLSAKEQIFLTEMLNKNIRSPLTSSMGRLFDGIAFILGLRRQVSYNAQAAILLEQQAARAVTTEYYDFNLRGEIIDHLPIIRGVVNDRDSGIQICTISRKFHNSIALIIRDTAKLIREETGIKEVVLSGGVFQNAELLLMTLNLLQDSGFKPLVHQLVPPNDGGLSLGQVVSSLGFINST